MNRFMSPALYTSYLLHAVIHCQCSNVIDMCVGRHLDLLENQTKPSNM